VNLEFTVNNSILKRTDTNEVISKNYDVYRCRFTFDDEEWVDLNKFAIFKDGWGNSVTVHIGTGSTKLCCMIPSKVLDGTYFKVSLYGGDMYSTNNVSIPMVTSGYMHGVTDPVCTRKQKDIFVEIFEELDAKIDSLVYDNNCLHLFCKDTLVESVYLPFVSEATVQDLMNTFTAELRNKADIDHVHENVSHETSGFMTAEDKIKLDSIEAGANHITVDEELDSNSTNAISNQAVSIALNGKEDSFNFLDRVDDLIQTLITKDE